MSIMAESQKISVSDFNLYHFEIMWMSKISNLLLGFSYSILHSRDNCFFLFHPFFHPSLSLVYTPTKCQIDASYISVCPSYICIQTTVELRPAAYGCGPANTRSKVGSVTLMYIFYMWE